MSVVNEVAAKAGAACDKSEFQRSYERMEARAKRADREPGIHDQRDHSPSDTIGLPWLVISQDGLVIVECKSREEARKEWRKLKGV